MSNNRALFNLFAFLAFCFLLFFLWHFIFLLSTLCVYLFVAVLVFLSSLYYSLCFLVIAWFFIAVVTAFFLLYKGYKEINYSFWKKANYGLSNSMEFYLPYD